MHDLHSQNKANIKLATFHKYEPKVTHYNIKSTKSKPQTKEETKKDKKKKVRVT